MCDVSRRFRFDAKINFLWTVGFHWGRGQSEGRPGQRRVPNAAETRY